MSKCAAEAEEGITSEKCLCLNDDGDDKLWENFSATREKSDLDGWFRKNAIVSDGNFFRCRD